MFDFDEEIDALLSDEFKQLASECVFEHIPNHIHKVEMDKQYRTDKSAYDSGEKLPVLLASFFNNEYMPKKGEIFIYKNQRYEIVLDDDTDGITTTFIVHTL
jgi:hypothetical protein